MEQYFPGRTLNSIHRPQLQSLLDLSMFDFHHENIKGKNKCDTIGQQHRERFYHGTINNPENSATAKKEKYS